MQPTLITATVLHAPSSRHALPPNRAGRFPMQLNAQQQRKGTCGRGGTQDRAQYLETVLGAAAVEMSFGRTQVAP